MIAPRLVWMPPDFDVAYVSKSDYDELQNQVDRAFSMLEANGVPRTRAKYVSNGIDVLATRFSKQVNELQQSNIHNVELTATEYAEYILDHYDRKSRKDRKLLGKHLAEWADRRYRDAAPIPSIKITNEMAYAFHRAITDSDLGSDDVAEIKKGLAAALANYAVPIPPTVTPSQQKVLSAVDTLLATFDSGYHPELNLIRDFMLARPDAPIPTTGETK